ncbi:hypothetical protein [Sulfuracidifex tepidarius]|uniref:Uncharacterized protein n=1 Tax=Sulfuracidifex tepidarius TaxID=1294262 RepID=A0A510E4Z7_9CREN|nr:hypothetical protein [Sulfuracidifex tepidarius]BBG24719.1 hypothetical protein IC006_2053 [Sulfuracidifex tepidarius]BBG27507.1 hypothetical protein IC007_2061 [Sulfuracidifex tepidarius]
MWLNLLKVGLLGSAVALAMGGLLLFRVVPPLVTGGTVVALAVLISLFMLASRKHIPLISTLIGGLEIVTSAISGAHDRALAEFGSSSFISAVDILMVLGFYIFPLLTVIGGLMAEKNNIISNKADRKT